MVMSVIPHINFSIFPLIDLWFIILKSGLTWIQGLLFRSSNNRLSLHQCFPCMTSNTFYCKTHLSAQRRSYRCSCYGRSNSHDGRLAEYPMDYFRGRHPFTSLCSHCRLDIQDILARHSGRSSLRGCNAAGRLRLAEVDPAGLGLLVHRRDNLLLLLRTVHHRGWHAKIPRRKWATNSLKYGNFETRFK